MKMLAEFDFRKATQAIGYLARREGGQIGKLKLIKLAYLADRYHLRRYGRPIFNDAYLAMPFGPVGSSVKDIAELSTFLSSEEQKYAAQYIEKGTGDHTVRSLDRADMDVFSDSEEEALTLAYDRFGKLTASALVTETHRYPEWKRHASNLEQGASRIPLSYEDFFEGSAPAAHDKLALSPEVLAASREQFEELRAVAKFWK